MLGLGFPHETWKKEKAQYSVQSPQAIMPRQNSDELPGPLQFCP